MSTCFECEIQTVYIQLLEPNQNSRKPTSKIKTEPKKIWTVAALIIIIINLIVVLLSAFCNDAIIRKKVTEQMKEILQNERM